MIIIAGAVVLLLIIFAVAYTMMSSGGEPAPAPSPADALEADLPPSEERSADQESELMQKKQEASEDANAPTPDVQKKEVKKVPIEKEAPTAKPKDIDGLVGHYTAESWNKKANEWKDVSGKNNHVTEIKGIFDVDDDDGIKYVFGDKNAGCKFPTKVYTKGRKYTMFHVADYSSEQNRGRIFDGTDGNVLSGFWAGRKGVKHAGASRAHGWLTHYNAPKREGWVISSDQKHLFRANGVQVSQGKETVSKRQHGAKQMTLNFGQFTDAVKRADRGVTLWKHCSYGGNRVTKTSGAYRRARIGAQDNDISSLQVPSGMELTIFDRPDLKGKSKTFKGPTKDSCLVNDGWNDKLSSMIIKNTTGGGFGRESSKWKVAEVLFYNRELSLDEITKVENYLMKKYKKEREIRHHVWNFSTYNHDKTAGRVTAHDKIGFSCGPEGAIERWRLHAHGGSGWKNGIGNHNFQYEGMCLQNIGGSVDMKKKTSYVDAPSGGAAGLAAYQKLINQADCRGSPMSGFHFEKSKDGTKARMHYACNSQEVDEDTCRDVTAGRHRKRYKNARLKSDGLLSAMHLQEIQCGGDQVLTKMHLEDQDNGEIHLKGQCCSLQDI